MMRAMALTSPTTLLALPSELIETILVCSSSPRTVASVAQTCRTLHTLIYASPDSHLWRELFLTLWDDPRPAIEHYALVDPRIDSTAWDWGTEYRKRVSAERWLKAWRRSICLAEHGAGENTDATWYNTALSALSAVLNTLLTLRPFPSSPPITLRVLTPAISPYPTGNVGSGVGDRREHLTSAPPLPPLLIMLASGFSVHQESRSAVRLGRMVYGPHTSHALLENGGAAAELTQPSTSTPIPTPSLPPQLVRTLLPSHTVGVHGLPTYAPLLSGADHWGDDTLGDIFHRIICITGFVPIPPPLLSTSTSAHATVSESVSEDIQPVAVAVELPMDLHDAQDELETQEDEEENEESDDDYHESDEQHMCHTTKGFPAPSEQHADARLLARRRVYDMRYLRGDRLWGPFRLVTRESLQAPRGASGPDIDGKSTGRKGRNRPSTSEAASGRANMHSLGTLAWVGMDIEPDDFDSTSNESGDLDEDWHDLADGNSEFSPKGRQRGRQRTLGDEDADGDLDSEAESMGPEHPLISLILASTVTSDAELATNTVSTTSPYGTRRPKVRIPPSNFVSPHQIKAQHLRPDYAFLASVRIVVEANMRELFGTEISDNVERTASQERVGGVGMFWEDEDEILRERVESLGSGPSSSSHAKLTPTTTTPVVNAEARTFELADILSQFRNLEAARLGGVCGYWGGWIERPKSTMGSVDENADASASFSFSDIKTRKPRVVTQRDELEKPIEGASKAKDKGKGKQKERESAELGDWEIGAEGEACQGWDWAGVAGIWRRCVCWMDYRELLFYNLDSTKFLTLDTQEACRIIPMEIRITGYTRAELMPVYGSDPACDNAEVFPSMRRSKTGAGTSYFRPPPIIHFSGSSVGSDRGLDDGREVRGTVQLIGGGEVRWQMDTYIQDTYTQESTVPGTSTPEWTSEAVQAGGLGSAIGVLGMWTGARHERADPLGPFWAWKVA